jgi:transposase
MVMDDSRCREFFSQPTQSYHRQYEALRAVFMEGHSQKEVADRFGYTYDSLRQLVHEFRKQGGPVSDGSPFFVS